MTLNQKLERIADALVTGLTHDGELVCNVYHYWRPQMQAPFVVWGEDGEVNYSLDADDRKAEQAVAGYVDYYTKTEFDPVIDTIQEILNGMTGFPFQWRLAIVLFEEETNLIHYQWEWSCA